MSGDTGRRGYCTRDAEDEDGGAKDSILGYTVVMLKSRAFRAIEGDARVTLLLL